MLLDPETLDLAAARGPAARPSAGDPRFKRELPAAQIEIETAPAATRGRGARPARRRARDLARPARASRRPAVAGAHPFAATAGELNDGERYERDFSAATRRSRAASWSRASRSTSRSAAPRARWRSTTRCAPSARASPRWPPTRPSTPVATRAWPPCARRSPSAPAPGRPAGDRDLGGVRRGAALGRARRQRRRAAARGGGSCARTRPSARWSCAFPTRRRRLSRRPASWRSSTRSSRRWPSATTPASRCRAAPTLAHRGEPLVGAAPRPRGPTGRPAHGRAARPRASGCRRCWTSSSRSPRGSAAPPRWPPARALAQRNGALRQREVAAVETGAAGCGGSLRRRVRARAAEYSASVAGAPRPRGGDALPGARAGRSRGAADALRTPPHRLPPIAAARRSPTRSPTTISSSRSTCATSCTTAAWRVSTSAGSGTPACSRSARRSRTPSRPRCARGRPRRRRRRPRTWTSRCARSPTPTRHRRCRATSSARRRPRRCASSSCTARPTSSRRPTRTRGRSRA